MEVAMYELRILIKGNCAGDCKEMLSDILGLVKGAVWQMLLRRSDGTEGRFSFNKVKKEG